MKKNIDRVWKYRVQEQSQQRGSLQLKKRKKKLDSC